MKATEMLKWLQWAKGGDANFAQNRNLTELGHQGYWELEQIGSEPCESYYMQGGFLVNSHAVYRSRLTDKGQRMLAQLEGKHR